LKKKKRKKAVLTAKSPLKKKKSCFNCQIAFEKNREVRFNKDINPFKFV